jgi:REP element-mobilizing transposase RayT
MGTIVRAYKASVTFRINAIRGFTKPPVWQRNYYEQIICNEKELENIWKYIDANPERWDEDKFHS